MNTIKRKYSISEKSIAEKDKNKNGDFCLYRELTDENIIVLVLSDGVGSRHHDHVASQTACTAFIEVFSKDMSNDISKRFEEALKKADKEVSEPADSSHKGMMCTFVGLVWNLNENYILYDSIGDSRLYKYAGSGLVQISSDSKKAVVMRDPATGKLLIRDGVIVIREGITNALGYNKAEISVKQVAFNPGEALILCSDGMYGIDDFDLLLSESLESPDLENSIEKFVSKNQEKFDDDASILIIRRSDQPLNYKHEYEKVIQQQTDYRQNNLIPHLLSSFMQSEILMLIDHKNSDTIYQYASYIDKFHLRLTEDFIMKGFQLMKDNNIVIDSLHHLLVKQLKVLKW